MSLEMWWERDEKSEEAGKNHKEELKGTSHLFWDDLGSAESQQQIDYPRDSEDDGDNDGNDKKKSQNMK
jgi:hypothetical protein